MRELLSISPGASALVLVDLQEEHRLDSRYLVEGYAGVLANARRLLRTARATGVPVLHAAYVRDFGKVPPRPFEPTTATGAPSFSAGESALTAICPEVNPNPGEDVFARNDASCFGEPAFRARLAALGVEWLAVCGVWTEACVATTVREATAAGFRVLLVKDACGSGTTAMHETAVINLANRLYGGAVADMARASTILGGTPAEAWRPKVAAPLRFTYADAAEVYAAL